MVQRRGLGRGLGALIPGAEEPSGGPQEISLAALQVNPFQPRRQFGEAALQELAATIRTHGVLTPVVVRRTGDGYQIIAGERRVRAAKLAGLTHVPAVVREVSDGQALEMALVENLQREDLNPLESAEAYQRLVDEFGLSQEAVATRVGRDRSTVANALRLLRLPQKLREDVASGLLTEGHARALLGLERPADQLRAREAVVGRHLTVRATEELVRRLRGDRPPATEKKRPPADPNLGAIEERLRLSLGTKVRIVKDGRGGRVEISFFSDDDLTRVVEAISGER